MLDAAVGEGTVGADSSATVSRIRYFFLCCCLGILRRGGDSFCGVLSSALSLARENLGYHGHRTRR